MFSHHSMAHYYKLDLFLKQVKTMTYEFALDVSGFKDFAMEAIQAAISDSRPKVHDELRKMMERLEIVPKQESVMQADMWMRCSDDMQVFVQSPRVRTDYIKEKMKEVMTMNPSWMEEA